MILLIKLYKTEIPNHKLMVKIILIINTFNKSFHPLFLIIIKIIITNKILICNKHLLFKEIIMYKIINHFKNK